jgi:hypothetical protein
MGVVPGRNRVVKGKALIWFIRVSVYVTMLSILTSVGAIVILAPKR